MSKLKTQENDASVEEFIDNLEDTSRQRDCRTMLTMMQGITNKPAKMWGKTMVGFGHYHYTYASGHSGQWFITGFAPRKHDFTLYIMPGFDHFKGVLTSLGNHRLGKSCLYIKSLENVDKVILEQIIADSIEIMRDRYECD